MANTYFQFKQFIVRQDITAMKVTTDSCLFGAWVASQVEDGKPILDIGTGTGLLSLMLAQKTPAHIDAIEIDESAFQQAQANVEASPWKDQIHLIQQDAKHFTTDSAFDYIVSNPPFYENQLKSPDEKRNKAHHGGLTLRELISTISNCLAPGGSFFLLLPFSRFDNIRNEIEKVNLSIVSCVKVKQTDNHPFFRIMIRGGQDRPEAIKENEIVIRKATGEYSDEFTELLKDYYLHL